MKEKLTKHLENNYCVKIGHPTNKGVANTNMTYFIVAPKNGGKGRGEMGDLEFATQILNEIGEEYSTEGLMIMVEITNKFIFSLTKN